jgi:hypothetical protein
MRKHCQRLRGQTVILMAPMHRRDPSCLEVSMSTTWIRRHNTYILTYVCKLVHVDQVASKLLGPMRLSIITHNVGCRVGLT